MSDVAVVVVGCGPRGIAVLERLAQHLPDPATDQARVHIVVVDNTELGAGRVWRTDQPSWLTMNTVVRELTMAPDGPTACPLPGFQEWLDADPYAPTPGPDDYAPRRTYGRYLRDVYGRVVEALRRKARVTEIVGCVTDLQCSGTAYRVEVAVDGQPTVLFSRGVVLATGHPRTAGHPDMHTAAAFAAEHPELLYLAGDIVSEFDLDSLAPETPVGVIGLGLSFYDLLLSVTQGRGGEFVERGGRLAYLPSGKEPLLFAGSRGGVPLGTRGRNQKGTRSAFRPRIFTPAALIAAREHASRTRVDARLDFSTEVLPLLRAEVHLVALEAAVAARRGRGQADDFAARFVELGLDANPGQRDRLLERFGLTAGDLPSADRLARPFAGRQFADLDAFTDELRAFVVADVAYAEDGNLDGPLKAGLDVIREVRDLLRAAVEADGLRPGPDAARFYDELAPRLSLVSTGPPPERTRQFLALLDAGVITVVGPDVHLGVDDRGGCFTIESPCVAGSRREVTAVVDTRVPRALAASDEDPLIGGLAETGLAQTWSADHPAGSGQPVGLRVHPATGRLVAADGSLHHGLYATGVPTEGVRWFTQIGNGRPGARSAFHREADAIALDIARHRLDLEG